MKNTVVTLIVGWLMLVSAFCDADHITDDGRISYLPMSRSLLRSYAVQEVRWIHFSVHAVSMTGHGHGKTYYHLPYAPGKEGVSLRYLYQVIEGNRFRFALGNTKDEIYWNVSLSNQQGELLFHGFKSFRLKALEQGGFTIPEGAFHTTLVLNQKVRIELPDGVDSIRVIERESRDPSLIRLDQWLKIEYVGNKKTTLFPTYFSGKQGEVLVTYEDQTSQVFGLEDGGEISQLPMDTYGSVFVEGFQLFQSDPSQITVYERSSDGPGVSPIAEIPITKRSSRVLVRGIDRNKEQAIGVWFRNLRTGATGVSFEPSAEGFFPVLLDTGIHHIGFFWEDPRFDEIDNGRFYNPQPPRGEKG